jgi:osmoprotectant transport system permease protein
MPRRRLPWLLPWLLPWFLLSLLFPAQAQAEEPILRIGSKRFTESYILGEILRQTAAPFARAEHLQGLGNTAVVLAALENGNIELYPDYTGTIDFEVLKHGKATSLAQMRQELAARGIGMAVPLGFNNTYALAMRAADSRQHAITRISDLAGKGGLRFGLSPEFLGRNDGWPALAARYALTQKPTLIENGIAYEALVGGQIDVMDAYSTSSKVGKYGLTILQDDLQHFPRYDAILLYRLGIEQRFPKAWQAIRALEGKISPQAMVAMNAHAELDGQPFAQVAQAFVRETAGKPDKTAGKPAPRTLWARLFDEKFWPLTLQHVSLVLLSVLLACLVAIPLGILAAYRPRLRQMVLAGVGVLQTLPSLAVLTLLIALLGQIGMLPALLALFLYALLPIVRNTCTGLLQVPPGMRLAALALGLRPAQSLRLVELPLALPTLLAGVKIAAVTSVGTATIAAFVGAGGYGERIVIGLALNDNQVMLAGAIPAAVLALLTQAGFELIEWFLASRHGPL